jgi:hypothetical protein
MFITQTYLKVNKPISTISICWKGNMRHSPFPSSASQFITVQEYIHKGVRNQLIPNLSGTDFKCKNCPEKFKYLNKGRNNIIFNSYHLCTYCKPSALQALFSLHNKPLSTCYSQFTQGETVVKVVKELTQGHSTS